MKYNHWKHVINPSELRKKSAGWGSKGGIVFEQVFSRSRFFPLNKGSTLNQSVDWWIVNISNGIWGGFSENYQPQTSKNVKLTPKIAYCS